MENLEQTCASLRAQIAATEAQLAGLKRELEIAERAAAVAAAAATTTTQESPTDAKKDSDIPKEKEGHKTKWPLLAEEYRRYGRQMIVEQVGLKGQLKLKSAKILIVGAGGLGCPAALYLAGAGVGTLGLVDGDTVDTSNLHRQVLHQSGNVGMLKVDSAIEYLKRLNLHPTYIPHRGHLTPQEAPKIFKNYDLILDCTDNPATRYLISDTAVLLGKPLISASALRTEGQLMVLNYPPRPAGDKTGGPCYRCVFPKPPPADSVVSCADGGILGPVVGTMGVLQALEAIKVITSSPREEQANCAPENSPSLLIFSAYSTPPFRSIRLRSRRANCAVCSSEASVTLDTITSGSTDYVFFCGSVNPTALLSPEERISPLEYSRRVTQFSENENTTIQNRKPYIIDVREKIQYDICHLEHSINIPISKILSSFPQSQSTGNNNNNVQPSHQRVPLPPWFPTDTIPLNSADPIYVVCRLGNDSQIAVKKLKELGLDLGGERFIGDIRGGLRGWREEVDPGWPEY